MTRERGGRLRPAGAARAVLEAVERGESAALVVVVRDPRDALTGRRLLVTPSRSGGSLGHPSLDASARALARDALAPGGDVEDGVHELRGAEGRPVEVYLELHHPQPELVIVGAGHIAQPLCTVGSLLGCRVSVLDDRPDFATRERFPEADRVEKVDFSDPFREIRIHPLTHLVLVTRGHKYDYECLRRVLRADPPPAYIGMIGSRRRVRATYAQLLEEGIPRERIASVRAPVGLDLGAETPVEIALAVAAEIVLTWRGGSGSPLREEERVLERFFEAGEEGAGATPGGSGSRRAEDPEP
ncbi:MAG: hypothetical protein GWM92_13825 [Gemmatimonadetes bacterium]|nr:XdhC/CoxF family protein [Gemmatimonadota bacterium]NIR79806.1 XdhC/CoxF family protein [Gemmatimonadota bacterium]NIT88512.1 XdhC/CoxF family protein [Gemmatimonadota bacterium]NIU32332.1 XdhC/CoxF family protein [Gemmatimonadota bacterium]NIU36851.1 hypothetical protein [Gemmatimonadota bacterium]